MKAETQIMIARRTAICIIVLLVCIIPVNLMFSAAEMIPLVYEDLFREFVFPSLLFAPIVGIYWGFAWAVKRRKVKLATYFLFPHMAFIVGGVVEVGLYNPETWIMMLLFPFLLQGILGLLKLQTPSPPTEDNLSVAETETEERGSEQ